MPFAFRGKLEGVEGAVKALDGLAAKLRKKILKQAVTEASKILTKEAKRRAPVATKLLRKSIGRKVKVFRNTGAVVAIIGPRVGFKAEVLRNGRLVLSNPTRYAHLVELGTDRMAARAFLQPAFEATKAQMADVMRETIEQGIAEATQ